jgi:transmembrane sensor
MDSSPPIHDSPDDALLGRYAAGTATADEAVRVTRWAAASPAHQRQLDDIVRIWRVEPLAEVPRDEAAAWRRVQSGIATASLSSRTFSNRVRRIPQLGIAVATAVLVGVVAVQLLSRDSSPSDARPLAEYVTAVGEQSTVHLDGVTIRLGPGTKVVRHVDAMAVTGVAYFTVAQNAKHPVVVRTGRAAVRVLGTQFTVRQYDGESRSEIAVTDGRVAVQALNVRDASSAKVVAAGAVAVVDDSGIVVTSGAADATAWVRGELVFDATPLRMVAAELSRMYGTNIQIADSVLAGKSMTMRVAVSTHSLARVLDLISLTNGAHYTRVAGGYTLAPGRIVERAPKHAPLPQPEKSYGL